MGCAVALIEEVARLKSWQQTACAQKAKSAGERCRDVGGQCISLKRTGGGLDDADAWSRLLGRLKNAVCRLDW